LKGAKVVGIAEYNGAIYNPKGIDPESAHDWWRANKTLKGFPNAEFVSNGAQVILLNINFKLLNVIKRSLNIHVMF
jgi:glutamate dehydrogenase (NAD(P)+)